jgi:hypothetical protein
MSEILSNTGAKVWSESDYSELWLTVFDQLTGQGGESNIRLIDEAIGAINTKLDGYKFEYSSDENRLYISKGDTKLPVSLIDSNGHVASTVDGTTITIDANGVVSGISTDEALSETSKNPVQNKIITTELNSIKSQVSDNKAAISENSAKITDNSTSIKANETAIKANETAISLLNGEGEGSVKKAVSDGIAEVIAGAPESFDTLKELSDWISSHETSAAAMNSEIETNKQNIATNKQNISTNATNIATNKQNLSTHTSNADIHVTLDDKAKWNKVTEKVDNTADGANSLLTNITTAWTTTPTDDTYFIRQDTSGTNTFGRVKFSTLWTYIRSKMTEATTALAGLMSASDKTKLDGIAEGAEVNVQSDWSVTDTTSDAFIKNKPTIDTATSTTSTNAVQNKVVTTALNKKVDIVSGKGLSTNDYSTADKDKLSGIASGAEVNVQSDWSVTDTTSDAYIKNKPTIPSAVIVDSTISATSTNTLQNKVIFNGDYGITSKTTTFNGDVITEVDGNGYTRTTTFNSDGSITESITNSSGTVVATKTTTFNSDGSISETIS